MSSAKRVAQSTELHSSDTTVKGSHEKTAQVHRSRFFLSIVHFDHFYCDI
uniref:Uncharacterized protein n=1 Tax=Arion vulgaris TaxID=1028688 RepID=A0A0B7B6Q8_9EUPU